jgi:hypothetical protein
MDQESDSDAELKEQIADKMIDHSQYISMPAELIRSLESKDQQHSCKGSACVDELEDSSKALMPHIQHNLVSNRTSSTNIHWVT